MKMACGHIWRTGFWLRIAGRGIAISTDPPTFSERQGVARNTARIFGVKFEYLPKPRCAPTS